MVLLRGLVDAAGSDGCRQSLRNGLAGVISGFDVWQPRGHGDGENSRAHRECKRKKNTGCSHAAQRAGAVLREQIEFKNAKGQEVLSEGPEGEERADKICLIETDRAEEEKRQEKSHSEEPGCTRHEEQANSPAAMSCEIASNRIAQRHGGAEHDQDGSQDRNYVLSHVADNPSAGQGQIKASGRLSERGEYEYAPIPAMKSGEAVSDARNQLKRSGHAYNGGE